MAWWQRLVQQLERTALRIERDLVKVVSLRAKGPEGPHYAAIDTSLAQARSALAEARRAMLAAAQAAATESLLLKAPGAKPGIRPRGLYVYTTAEGVPGAPRAWDVLYNRTTGRAVLVAPEGIGMNMTFLLLAERAKALPSGIYPLDRFTAR